MALTWVVNYLNSNLRVCFCQNSYQTKPQIRFAKILSGERIDFDVRPLRVPVRENLPGYLWQMS